MFRSLSAASSPPPHRHLGQCPWLRLILGIFGLLTLHASVAWAQGDDDVASAQAKAQARVAAAESARAEGDGLRQHADYAAAEARDSNLASTWQRAEQLLNTARNAMGDATAAPSANAFRDAGILANGSRRAFEDFAGRIRRALRSIEAERAPPPPPPPPPAPPEAAPSKEPASESPQEPGTDASNQEDPAAPLPVNDYTAEPVAAEPATAPPPPPPGPRSTPRPTPRTEPKPPPLTSMAPPLRRAVEAYFQGDDEIVLEALATPNDLGSGVHKAHALMVRAAARYQLFLLGGERDHAQRSAAVDDVLACRRLVEDLAPSRDLFSPRFVDFFRGVQLPKQP